MEGEEVRRRGEIRKLDEKVNYNVFQKKLVWLESLKKNQGPVVHRNFLLPFIST